MTTFYTKSVFLSVPMHLYELGLPSISTPWVLQYHVPGLVKVQGNYSRRASGGQALVKHASKHCAMTCSCGAVARDLPMCSPVAVTFASASFPALQLLPNNYRTERASTSSITLL